MYAEAASDAFYDHDLLNSADSIVARMQIVNGGVICVLPKETRAIIDHRGADRFFFQVRDSHGKLLTEPSIDSPVMMPKDDTPIFFDGKAGKDEVRVAVFRSPCAACLEPLIIEVAETFNSRDAMLRRIVINVLLAQLAMIVFGSLAVHFAVGKGLLPLRSLQQALSQRATSDLGPVTESGVPKEVLSLVQAINDLLRRLQMEIDSQKRFVANAAHQMRTPVAGLKTYVGLAKRSASSSELMKILDHVDEGTDRLTHLTNRLLSLARAEPNNRRLDNRSLLDLNVVVSTALAELVAQAIKKEVELGFDASPEPASVVGDVGLLHELVINIVENAILYTQPGGRVSVRIKRGNGIMLAVEDNGPGIPADERLQVFERFYRVLGTDQTGSGLGLAIVKEIATAHGAHVLLDSGHTGKGTLVTVHLPEAAA